MNHLLIASWWCPVQSPRRLPFGWRRLCVGVSLGAMTFSWGVKGLQPNVNEFQTRADGQQPPCLQTWDHRKSIGILTHRASLLNEFHTSLTVLCFYLRIHLPTHLFSFCFPLFLCDVFFKSLMSKNTFKMRHIAVAVAAGKLCSWTVIQTKRDKKKRKREMGRVRKRESLSSCVCVCVSILTVTN